MLVAGTGPSRSLMASLQVGRPHPKRSSWAGHMADPIAEWQYSAGVWSVKANFACCLKAVEMPKCPACARYHILGYLTYAILAITTMLLPMLQWQLLLLFLLLPWGKP